MSEYYNSPGLWSGEELSAGFAVADKHRKILHKFIDFIYNLMNSETSSEHEICQVVRDMKTESDDKNWGPFFALIFVNRRARELILRLRLKRALGKKVNGAKRHWSNFKRWFGFYGPYYDLNTSDPGMAASSLSENHQEQVREGISNLCLIMNISVSPHPVPKLKQLITKVNKKIEKKGVNPFDILKLEIR